MRALQILHRSLAKARVSMHQARWRALWAAVHALVVGGRLSLTGLGRARPGTALPKHNIKAMDRLLGNRKLHAERHMIYAELARQVCGAQTQPIILVDTVEVCPAWYALVASVPFRGRSFPICATATRHVKVGSRELEQFLEELSRIVPKGARPTLVADAGFENTWFSAVEARGWDYVGRVRNTTKVCLRDEWVPNSSLHHRAIEKALDLGVALIRRRSPLRRRLVLGPKPTSSKRYRKTRKGTPGKNGTDRAARARAHDPWLLATSRTDEPAAIVAIYARRMRIEQTFRDAKNHRWGWSLRHCRCRTAARLEVLLLIGAIGLFAQQVVGIAAEQLGLHRRYQANTESSRRVLSIFVLGKLVLRNADPIGTASILDALRQLREGREEAAWFCR